MAPVIAAMRDVLPAVEHVVVDTGQHYDYGLSQVFVEQLALSPPNYRLKVGSGSHGAQTARALERIERVLEALRPAALVVPGDVNSTLAGRAGGCQARHSDRTSRGGLRSFDRSMPEEINRVLTDQTLDVVFHAQPGGRRESPARGSRRELDLLRGQHDDRHARADDGRRGRSTILREPRARDERDTFSPRLHRPGLVDGATLEPVLGESHAPLRVASGDLPGPPADTRARIDNDRQRGSLRLIAAVGYVDFLALESNAARSSPTRAACRRRRLPRRAVLHDAGEH